MRKSLNVYFGQDIPLNENVSIRQPRMFEIINIGEDKFNKYILPYTINLSLLFDDEVDTSDIDIYELFFTEDGGEGGSKVLDGLLEGDSINLLVESLSFFTGVNIDNIKVLKNRRKIIIDESYVLDKLSFIEFRKLIQAISVRKDLEVEKAPTKMNSRQLDVWKKLQEGRKRKAMRESLKIEDMANFISYCGNTYIPTESLLSMTFFQFNNAYTATISMDNYRTMMEYKLSQKYDVKDEVKHWTKTMRVDIDLE